MAVWCVSEIRQRLMKVGFVGFGMMVVFIVLLRVTDSRSVRRMLSGRGVCKLGIVTNLLRACFSGFSSANGAATNADGTSPLPARPMPLALQRKLSPASLPWSFVTVPLRYSLCPPVQKGRMSIHENAHSAFAPARRFAGSQPHHRNFAGNSIGDSDSVVAAPSR